MLNTKKLYVKKDFEQSGAWWVSEKEAKEYNLKNFGVFWSPNIEENEKRRIKENVKRIYWWYADLDQKLSGGKEEQYQRIKALPCKPNWVVETKNGFHCYWKAKDGTKKNWDLIIRGIIVKLQSDPAVKGENALLRAVGYYHCKDPKNRFLVHTVYENDEEFTEKEMLYWFRLPPERPKVYEIKYSGLSPKEWLNPDNFEKLYHLSSISEGCRNNMLKDKIYKAYKNGVIGSDLIELALKLNSCLKCQPLPRGEVIAMTRRLK